MATEKNKKGAEKDEIKATSEYYKLHTDAVNDLVNADEDNSPEVSEAELNKYRSGWKIKIPDWLKALLIKAWFAGSVCFFIFWGLSAYIGALLDILLVFGVVLGMVTDILTNNILRFYAKTPGANDRWMMFPKRRYASFFGNIVYACVLLACVSWVYSMINLILLSATDGKAAPFGVEPILFGVLYTLCDLLFLAMKHTFASILSDAKKKVKSP